MKKSYLFGLAAESTVLIRAATEVLAEESDGEIPASETAYYIEEDTSDQVEQIYVESEDVDVTEDADKEDNAAGEDAVTDGNEVKAPEEEKEDSADSTEVTDPVTEADDTADAQAGEDEVQEEVEIPDPLTLNTEVYPLGMDMNAQTNLQTLKNIITQQGGQIELSIIMQNSGNIHATIEFNPRNVVVSDPLAVTTGGAFTATVSLNISAQIKQLENKYGITITSENGLAGMMHLVYDSERKAWGIFSQDGGAYGQFQAYTTAVKGSVENPDDNKWSEEDIKEQFVEQVPSIDVTVDGDNYQTVKLTPDMFATNGIQSSYPGEGATTVSLSVEQLAKKMGLDPLQYFFTDFNGDHYGSVNFSSKVNWSVTLNDKGVWEVGYSDLFNRNGWVNLTSMNNLSDPVAEMIDKVREYEVPVCNISDNNKVTYIKMIPGTYSISGHVSYVDGKPSWADVWGSIDARPYVDAFNELKDEHYSFAWFQKKQDFHSGVSAFTWDQYVTVYCGNFSWTSDGGFYTEPIDAMVYVQLGDGSMPKIPGTLGTEVDWPSVGGSSTTNASSSKGPHTGISKNGTFSLYSWAAALSAGMFAFLKRRSKREA